MKHLRLPRRIGGAAGAPDAAGYRAGQLVLNFPGAAGSAALTPEIWAHDGAVFRRANPPGAVVRSFIAGPDQGSAVATFNADEIDVIAGDLVIYSYRGATYAYAGSPGTPAVAQVSTLVRLGEAPVYASIAETLAGTEASKSVTPQGLAGITIATPSATQANDANKMLRLGSDGRIHSGFWFRSLGPANFTAAPPALAPTAGSIVINTTAGIPAAGWAFPNAPTWVAVGDMAIFDGSNYRHLSNAGGFDGGRMRAAAKIEWPGGTGSETGRILIDLRGGGLDNAVIDGGTF